MKTLFLIISLLLPAYASSQNLLFDKPTQDGSRYIGSYYAFHHTSMMDGNPIGFSVNGITKDGKIQEYFLGLKIATTSSFQLPKGGLLLLKCPDGTVIELYQRLNDDETDDIHFFDKMNVLTFNILGEYGITFEQLCKIEKDGISKLRIETEGSPIDREYSKKKCRRIAECLHIHLEEIKKAIRNPRDLRSDF